MAVAAARARGQAPEARCHLSVNFSCISWRWSPNYGVPRASIYNRFASCHYNILLVFFFPFARPRPLHVCGWPVY